MAGWVDVPHHLLTLWNPSYAADAMDEHLSVLLDWAGRWRRGEAPDDEVYVWWGRLRSPNRKGALPHADAIGALSPALAWSLRPARHRPRASRGAL